MFSRRPKDGRVIMLPRDWENMAHLAMSQKFFKANKEQKIGRGAWTENDDTQSLRASKELRVVVC